MTKRDAIFFLLQHGQSANNYFSTTAADLGDINGEVDFEASAEPTLGWHRIDEVPPGGHAERALVLGAEIVTPDKRRFPFVFVFEGIALTELFNQVKQAGELGWDGVNERLAKMQH